MVIICDCGLTGGCEKCRPEWHSLPHVHPVITKPLININRRDDLPPLERALSDTLDEWLYRMHGVISSWAAPVEFIEWLMKRGYEVREIAGAISVAPSDGTEK